MTAPHASNTCPVCQGYVGIQENGTLFPHLRYADGSGYGPDQPHDLVACEGGSAEITVSDGGDVTIGERVS